MPTGSSFQLVRLFGIRIGVSTSWFVVLFVFIFILSGSFQDVLGGSDTQAYAVAVAAALLFFVSLILHELGHALTARRAGIEITGIDLWFFGGIAKMSRDTRTPGEEFRVSAAGPAVTLAIVVLCVAIGAAIDGRTFVDTALLDRGVTDSPGLLLLGWLATINAFLLVFNLIPAFPLDGGRIARAVVWRITGEKSTATRFSGRAGQLFAYVMGGYGLYLLFTGSTSNGLWLAVLAVFLGQAAGDAVRQSAIDERLEGVTVGDVMDPRPYTVSADLTVLEVADQVFAAEGWPWVPVVEDDGRFAGVLHHDAVDRALSAGRPALAIRDVVREDGWRWRIDVGEPLEALIGTDGLRQLGAVFAVDREGMLRGVVTADQVRRALTPAPR
jgi:Zn-dependent protease